MVKIQSDGRLEGVVANTLAYSSTFSGVSGHALVANERVEEDKARQDLVTLNNQVEGFTQFWRDAMEARYSAGSGAGSGDSCKSYDRPFPNSVGNEMNLTCDKPAGSSPTRYSDTSHVALDGRSYFIPSDSEPYSYPCHGGNLTGRKVHRQFSGGESTKAWSDYDGKEDVTVMGRRAL